MYHDEIKCRKYRMEVQRAGRHGRMDECNALENVEDIGYRLVWFSVKIQSAAAAAFKLHRSYSMLC